MSTHQMPSRPLASLVWTILLMASVLPGQASKILVFPVDGSHWLNMEVLVKQLHGRGHQITVVRSPESWYIKERSPHYAPLTVRLPQDKEIGLELFEQSAQRILEGRLRGSLMGSLVEVTELMSILHVAHRATCAIVSLMLDDRRLVQELRAARYDLMLTDPAMPAGVLLGHYLRLPMVYNVRWMSFGEGHFSIAPSPVSYVPVPGSGLSDRMGFVHRARNMFHYALNLVQERWLVVPIYRELIRKHFPPGSDLLSMQLTADVWLMRVDFVFEFPRPSMPNLVYMGGFQCRPAKPLPGELEAFVQSSGQHGVVVMSLGTLINALPRETTEIIASAFARLPQKVIWRFAGAKPRSLGNNTLLLEWLPQNDLLGHPKTRAFVAHGGTNGLYEAIYHGVPVLGVPLLFDQTDNLVRLQARGAARMLDMASLTPELLVRALKDVLHNPTYRGSMQRLSGLHRDQPLHPLDKAVFWIEYVLRNKGAPHLRSEASAMPWYSYYTLDVIALLLGAPFGLLCVVVFLIRAAVLRKAKGAPQTTAQQSKEVPQVNAKVTLKASSKEALQTKPKKLQQAHSKDNTKSKSERKKAE
ncbi:UDP glucuronosyltransferase 5 family, polypeptide G2 [Sardina pilchardus]|uniref:UDP glucuronosyltransferase 5 family, polypeptide G2 n=1 Tax=Sardina pilchardus TaxID=27697 RepID=UPI002E122F40